MALQEEKRTNTLFQIKRRRKKAVNEDREDRSRPKILKVDYLFVSKLNRNSLK